MEAASEMPRIFSKNILLKFLLLPGDHTNVFTPQPDHESYNYVTMWERHAFCLIHCLHLRVVDVGTG